MELGIHPVKLSNWIRRDEIDNGYHRPGVPSSEGGYLEFVHGGHRMRQPIRSRCRLVGRRLQMLNRAVALCLGSVVFLLAGCSYFLPSRPLPDWIFARNTDNSVEIVLCRDINVQEILVSRRGADDPDFGESATIPLEWEAGRGLPISLAEIATRSDLDFDTGPLAPGESLDLLLTYRDTSSTSEDDMIQYQSVLIKAPEDRTLAELRRTWISGDRSLVDTPCEPK